MQGWNSFSTCETKVSIFIFTIVFDANEKKTVAVFLSIFTSSILILWTKLSTSFTLTLAFSKRQVSGLNLDKVKNDYGK